jgi:hypothetical protein
MTRLALALTLLVAFPGFASSEDIEAVRLVHLTHLAGSERVPVVWWIVEHDHGPLVIVDPRECVLTSDGELFALEWIGRDRVYLADRLVVVSVAAEVAFGR